MGKGKAKVGQVGKGGALQVPTWFLDETLFHSSLCTLFDS